MADAAFDAYAPSYGELVNTSVGGIGQDVEFFARSKARGLLRTAGGLGRPVRDVKVLDVGCGTGLTDSYLVGYVGSLDGVDVSSEMVAAAADRNPSATYQVYGGSQLPFADGSFDLVFAACVLHHVPPAVWDGFVAELWRVTAAPGAAVVIEHNPSNPFTRRAVHACPFDEDAVLARPSQVIEKFRRTGVQRPRRRFVTFFPVDLSLARHVEDLLGWLPMGAQYTVSAFR